MAVTPVLPQTPASSQGSNSGSMSAAKTAACMSELFSQDIQSDTEISKEGETHEQGSEPWRSQQHRRGWIKLGQEALQAFCHGTVSASQGREGGQDGQGQPDSLRKGWSEQRLTQKQKCRREEREAEEHCHCEAEQRREEKDAEEKRQLQFMTLIASIFCPPPLPTD
eukprot:1180518-Rhodomonas_salina.2